MDFNKLIARSKAVLMTPKSEWPVIAEEPTTIGSIYKNHVLILAAIPPLMVFLFFGLLSVGLSMFSAGRFGLVAGLTTALFQYGFGLLGVFLFSIIINLMAPTFGGQKDGVQAFKAAAYSATAVWIASLALIVPLLGGLVVFAAAIYSIYLLYVGLQSTMKVPADKAGGYTAVVILIAIVAGFICSMIFGAIAGAGLLMGGSHLASMARHSDDSSEVHFDKDSSMGKLEKWSKQMEQAGKNMEAAQKSGNAQAQNDALKQVMGAALGGGDVVESLPADRIKQFVPEELLGLKRQEFSAERNNAMGMQISTAKARYGNDAGKSLHLEVSDLGTAKGMLAFAGFAGIESDKETDHGYDKTYRQGEQLVHEQWDSQSKHGEYSLVVADRFTVKASGNADSVDELKSAVGAVNLSGLEALRNEGVKKAE